MPGTGQSDLPSKNRGPARATLASASRVGVKIRQNALREYLQDLQSRDAYYYVECGGRHIRTHLFNVLDIEYLDGAVARGHWGCCEPAWDLWRRRAAGGADLSSSYWLRFSCCRCSCFSIEGMR